MNILAQEVKVGDSFWNSDFRVYEMVRNVEIKDGKVEIVFKYDSVICNLNEEVQIEKENNET